MTIPYTYSVYCIPTKQYYYGVRFAKGCDPKDLWVKYFTSSSYVKRLIELYGKGAFIPKVRKVFKNKKTALLWESKILQRLNAALRDDFINKYDFLFFDFKDRVWINDGSSSKYIDTVLAKDYINCGWSYGRFFNAEHKKKISEAQTKRFKDPTKNPMYGKKQSTESKEKNRLWQLNRSETSNETKQKISKSLGKGYIVDEIVYNSARHASKVLGIPRHKLKGIHLQP